MGSPERPVPDSSNVIFPRRKQGQHKKHGRKEGVVVTMEILETVFHLPLHKACKDLGVCATALKRACRKLGVKKWPYRDQQCQPQRAAVLTESSAEPREVWTAAEPSATSQSTRANHGRDETGAKWESRDASTDSEKKCKAAGNEPATLPETAIAMAITRVAGEEQAVASLGQSGPVDSDTCEDRGSFFDGGTVRSDASHGTVDDDAMSSSSFSDESSSVLSSVPSSPMSACPLSIKTGRGSTHRAAAASPALALAQVQRAAIRPKHKSDVRKTMSAHVTAVTSASQPALVSEPLPCENIDPGASGAMQDSSNVIFPRRKQGQHKKHGRKEGVVVTMEILETVFHLPLHKACNELGVCATALKRACRKLGVQKWPYRDQQCQSQRSTGASPEEIREEAPSRMRTASTNLQQLQRGKATGGMREGTRGASLRIGARAAVQRGGEQDSQNREGHVSKEEPTSTRAVSVSNISDNSSDFESSVDTRIAPLHDDMAQEHDMPEVQQCIGSPAAFAGLIQPSEDSMLLSTSRSVDDLRACAQYVNHEDDFDSFDSEEDGLVSDEFETWGLTEARLDRFSSETLSLEDCLKV